MKRILFFLLLMISTKLFCLVAKQQLYQEVNLVISFNDVQIGGTLTIPKEKKSEALVIMSSGSGQQDRDETLDGFKIFKVISAYLAEKGIPSFRYDDRGVGASTGDFVNSSIFDFSNDIMGLMDYFESSSTHNFTEFVLFGHSLGGIISGDVAEKENRVKQLILMATPAAPLIDLIIFQERQSYLSSSIPIHLIEKEMSAQQQLMMAIHVSQPIDQLIIKLKKSIQNILDVHPMYKDLNLAEKEQKAEEKAQELSVVYGLPSIESYLYHNPLEAISKLDIPVLAFFGGKDTQVTIAQNKDALEKALLRSGTDYEITVFDYANHYFQHAQTGAREEYGRLDQSFVSGFLERISTFIINHQ